MISFPEADGPCYHPILMVFQKQLNNPLTKFITVIENQTQPRKL